MVQSEVDIAFIVVNPWVILTVTSSCHLQRYPLLFKSCDL